MNKQKMDFNKVCRDFQSKKPAEFIAMVRDFIVAQYKVIEASDEPAIHPDDIPSELAVLYAFERQTLEHLELYDNWLVFALFNCYNVPRTFLFQDDIQNKNAMTPLKSALLPMASVLRAPHFAALKTQIAEYLENLPQK